MWRGRDDGWGYGHGGSLACCCADSSGWFCSIAGCSCGVGWVSSAISPGCVWSGAGVGFLQLHIRRAEPPGGRGFRSDHSRSRQRLCQLAAPVSDPARCLGLSRVRPLGHRWSVECGHLRANHLRCRTVASAAHSFAFPRLVGLSCRCAVDSVDQICILCHVRDDLYPVRNLVVDPDRRVSPRRQADGLGLGGGVHRPGLPHAVYWRHGDSGYPAVVAPPLWRCAGGEGQALRGVYVDFPHPRWPVGAAKHHAHRRALRSQRVARLYFAGSSGFDSRRSLQMGDISSYLGGRSVPGRCTGRNGAACAGGSRWVCSRAFELERQVFAGMELFLRIRRLCAGISRLAHRVGNGHVRLASQRQNDRSCVYSTSVRRSIRAG